MTDRKRRLADLEALLLRSATEQLPARDLEYLDELRRDFPDIDAATYDRVVSAVLLATLGPLEPMPSTLRSKILASSAPAAKP